MDTKTKRHHDGGSGDATKDFRGLQWAKKSIIWGFVIIKGSLGGETSVLRTFRMSGKELVKERVSQRNS